MIANHVLTPTSEILYLLMCAAATYRLSLVTRPSIDGLPHRRSGKFRWGVRGDCGLIGARECRPMKEREIIDNENDFEMIENKNNKCNATSIS
jgi:hypothetical protein